MLLIRIESIVIAAVCGFFAAPAFDLFFPNDSGADVAVDLEIYESIDFVISGETWDLFFFVLKVAAL